MGKVSARHLKFYPHILWTPFNEENKLIGLILNLKQCHKPSIRHVKKVMKNKCKNNQYYFFRNQ